jgi:hypothetical protein
MALGAILLVSAAACTQAEEQTIAATLENAQSQTLAIWTAVQGFVPTNLSQPIGTALQVAETGVAAFEADASGSGTALQDAAKAAADLEPLLNLLPIPAVTVAAIKLGLTLIVAFANGTPAIAAPAPTASPAVGAEPVKIIPAPIPIPVPVS